MNRVVAAQQPNFLPWLGFFDKLALADVFVLLDDVQFSRGGRTNRVELMVSGRRAWATVPVVRRSGLHQINELAIDDSRPWREKLMRSVEQSYAHAHAVDECMSLVGELVFHRENALSSYNERNIRLVAETLGLGCELVRSSHLGVDAVGTERLVMLVRAVGGTTYLSGDGAAGYFEPERFTAAGIRLRYQSFSHPTYPQRHEPFQPGLSVVDALLNCGVAGTRALLR